MVDTNKIKGVMREQGLTQSDVASALGMPLGTFNGKLNNRYEFDLTEGFMLMDFLCLSPQQMDRIILRKNVPIGTFSRGGA